MGRGGGGQLHLGGGSGQTVRPEEGPKRSAEARPWDLSPGFRERSVPREDHAPPFTMEAAEGAGGAGPERRKRDLHRPGP